MLNQPNIYPDGNLFCVVEKKTKNETSRNKAVTLDVRSYDKWFES